MRRATMKKLFFPAFFFLSVILSGCGNSKPEKELSTPTSGTLKLSIDETLQPLAKEEIDAFVGEYRTAHIIPFYKPEAQAVTDFLKDSTEVIMLSRQLTPQENKVFEARELKTVTTKIAFDAIALVLNKSNPDTIFNYELINEIFSGKITDWKQIDTKKEGPINIVFDNKYSSTLRYMHEHFCKDGKLPSNWSALKSNPDVIDYVNQNKNALGVIGVNWISNYHTKAAMTYNDKVIVARIFPPDSAKGAGTAYGPRPENIAQRFYPLYRDIYMISREGRSGLGAGLMSYVATDKGQTIILQAGLVPANAPVRLVHITNKLEVK